MPDDAGRQLEDEDRDVLRDGVRRLLAKHWPTTPRQ